MTQRLVTDSEPRSRLTSRAASVGRELQSFMKSSGVRRGAPFTAVMMSPGRSCARRRKAASGATETIL
jgi:hypothetical protein